MMGGYEEFYVLLSSFLACIDTGSFVWLDTSIHGWVKEKLHFIFWGSVG